MGSMAYAKMVSDRLSFLNGLEQIIYGPPPGKPTLLRVG
jgi:hypothetical protein